MPFHMPLFFFCLWFVGTEDASESDSSLGKQDAQNYCLSLFSLVDTPDPYYRWRQVTLSIARCLPRKLWAIVYQPRAAVLVSLCLVDGHMVAYFVSRKLGASNGVFSGDLDCALPLPSFGQ